MLAKRLRRPQELESGFTVVEIMVSVVIIVMILLSTAYGLTTSFRASSTTENRTKAANIAQGVISVSKQADFRRLYVGMQTPVTPALFGTGKCNTSQTALPGTGMVRVATGTGTPYPGLVYCQATQAGNSNGGVGATFYVQTRVVYITTGQGSTSTNFYPKRVYVDVFWQDISSGSGKWNTYSTSYTRTPGTGDCIPDTITTNGAIPAGCKP